MNKYIYQQISANLNMNEFVAVSLDCLGSLMVTTVLRDNYRKPFYGRTITKSEKYNKNKLDKNIITNKFKRTYLE